MNHGYKGEPCPTGCVPCPCREVAVQKAENAELRSKVGFVGLVAMGRAEVITDVKAEFEGSLVEQDRLAGLYQQEKSRAEALSAENARLASWTQAHVLPTNETPAQVLARAEKDRQDFVDAIAYGEQMEARAEAAEAERDRLAQKLALSEAAMVDMVSAIRAALPQSKPDAPGGTPLESWRCSECGDVLTIPEKRLPKVCENCHSRIPFVRMPFPPPIRVTAATPGARCPKCHIGDEDVPIICWRHIDHRDCLPSHHTRTRCRRFGVRLPPKPKKKGGRGARK